MACSRMPKCMLRPPQRARLEVARALEGQARLGRGREVGRAADEGGMVRREGVHHLAGRVAARHALGVGGGSSARSASQPAGSSPASIWSSCRLHRDARRDRPPSASPSPAGAWHRACRCRRSKCLRTPSGTRNLRVLRPAVVALGEADLVGAQRLAVRGVRCPACAARRSRCGCRR